MKKRILALAMAAVCTFSLLASCATPTGEGTVSGGNNPATETSSGGEMQPRVLTLASQSVDSTAYARCSALASVMNEYLPDGWSVEVSPVSTGGAAGTLLVESGETDMGEGINISNKLLAEGTYDEQYPPLENCYCLLGGTDYAYFLIMFTSDFQQRTGFTTLEEVVASNEPFRLVTKAAGAAGELGCRQLLEVLGTDYDDIKADGGDVINVAPAEMVDLLKEGRADVLVDVVGLGQASMSELTMTSTMYFPQLEQETLDGLAEYGYVIQTMPAGSWGGQDEDILTGTNSANIVISKDIPDDVAYAMVKAVCEHKDELVAQVPVMEQYQVEYSGETSRNNLPIHPGAVKYYEEVGYTVNN